ncbi:MAG TPA: caspase family protein [Syntrophobacteraceae bacterium]|nr:caspase family protein [Syntrophobacteraceae bacterium]
MDRAVLVGIIQYEYENALHGCINDINDVEKLLQPLGFEIVKLPDEQATADEIRSALRESVKQLEAGDRFLFWYSGHGAELVEGDPSTDVLCPFDFDYTRDTSVTVDDFHGIFSGIPDGVRAYWVSDSCYSGNLDADRYNLGVPRQFRLDPDKLPVEIETSPSTPKGFSDISARLPNIVFISSCGGDQTSADACFKGIYNGAFTHFFLKEFQAGPQTPLDQLVPKVQKDLSAKNYVQVPELHGPDTITKLPFLGQPSAISPTGMFGTDTPMKVEDKSSTSMEETMNVKCPDCGNQFEVTTKSDASNSVVSAIFGSSPRTTIVGYLGAVAAAVVPLLQSGKWDTSVLAPAIVIAILGRLAKDAGATGPGT